LIPGNTYPEKFPNKTIVDKKTNKTTGTGYGEGTYFWFFNRPAENFFVSCPKGMQIKTKRFHYYGNMKTFTESTNFTNM
jgi:hypothetical protein